MKRCEALSVTPQPTTIGFAVSAVPGVTINSPWCLQPTGPAVGLEALAPLGRGRVR